MNLLHNPKIPLPAIALFLGGLLWVASLIQVAFYTTQGPVMGYWVFATGWLGFSLFQFAWYANLLILMAVLMMSHYPNRAMTMAVLAVLVGGHAFWFESIPSQGTTMHILRLGIGFWLWYASIILMALGVIFGINED
jgi:hypothetical protein